MARIAPEIQAIIWELTQRLLEIVDEAKAAEYNLLERFGETDRTIVALEQLTEITAQATARFSQLSTLLIRVAESQPVANQDLLRLLDERIDTIANRIPALARSIEEIKIDWNLL